MSKWKVGILFIGEDVLYYYYTPAKNEDEAVDIAMEKIFGKRKETVIEQHYVVTNARIVSEQEEVPGDE